MKKLTSIIIAAGAIALQGCSNGGGLSGNPSSSSSINSNPSSQATESSVSSEANSSTATSQGQTQAERGELLFTDNTIMCSTCHAPMGDGVFGAGVMEFNVNDFVHFDDSAQAALETYIADYMPTTDPDLCLDDCAADIAAYLWGLRDGAASSVPPASSSGQTSSTPPSSTPTTSSAPASVSSSPATSSAPATSSVGTTSSAATTSSVPVVTGPIELDASLTTDVSLNSADGDILELLLGAIGADGYDEFEAQLNASEFDQDLLSLYFSALADIFSTMDMDELTGVITGGGTIEADGLTITSVNSPAGTRLEIVMDKEVTLDDCDPNEYDCSIQVLGTINGLLSGANPGGDVFIAFGNIDLSMDSLRIWSDDGELEIYDTEVGFNQFYLEFEPLAIGGADGYPTSIDNLVLNLRATSGDVQLDVALSGTVGELVVGLGDDTVIDFITPDLTLSAKADGDSLGGNVSSAPASSSSESVASSTSSVVSSEPAESSSASTTSSVASTSSAPASSAGSSSSAGGGSLSGSLDSTASIDDSGDGLVANLLALVGAEAFEEFESQLTAAGFSGTKATILMSGLGSLFDGLDMDQLTGVITSGGTIEQDGLTITSVNSPAGIALTIVMDKTVTVSDCNASAYDCSVTILGTVDGTLSGANPGGEVFIAFGSVNLGVDSLRIWNSDGEIEIFDSAIAMRQFYLEFEPLAIGGADGYPTIIDSMEFNVRANNNDVDIEATIGGSLGELEVGLGENMTIDLISPDIGFEVNATGDGFDGSASSSSAGDSSSAPTSSSSVAVSSASSSSSVPVVIPDGGFIFSLTDQISVAGATTNGTDLMEQGINQVGDANYATYEQLMAALKGSGANFNKMAVLGASLGGVFTNLDMDGVINTITGGGTIEGDGYTITSVNSPAGIRLEIAVDKTVNVPNCRADLYDCSVRVQGTIDGVLSGANPGGEVFIAFGQIDLSADSLRIWSDDGEIEIFDTDIAMRQFYYEFNPMAIGGADGYPTSIESISMNARASVDGVEMTAVLGGSIAELIGSLVGTAVEVDVLQPNLSAGVDIEGGSVSSTPASSSSSSSSSQPVSSSSSSSSEPASSSSSSSSSEPALGGDPVNGQALYSANAVCQACHGADRQGLSAPPLTTASITSGSTGGDFDAVVAKILTMPGAPDENGAKDMAAFLLND